MPKTRRSDEAGARDSRPHTPEKRIKALVQSSLVKSHVASEYEEKDHSYGESFPGKPVKRLHQTLLVPVS